jgi:hypothetical protein
MSQPIRWFFRKNYLMGCIGEKYYEICSGGQGPKAVMSDFTAC